MPDPGLVLDADAMIAYAHGSTRVGAKIFEMADDDLGVLLPALCLAEAYRQVDSNGWPYLEILSTLPNVTVAPVEHDHCPFLGGWSRTLGRMDLAHAAIEAAAHPIVQLMTSQRRLITEFLPKEWPIIDI